MGDQSKNGESKYTPKQYAESAAKYGITPGPWVGRYGGKNVKVEYDAKACVHGPFVGGYTQVVSLCYQDEDAHTISQLPDLLIERDALKAENERLRKALEALVWPNVPSADDMAVLVAMCAGNDDRRRSAMELVDRLRIAQAEARAALTGGAA